MFNRSAMKRYYIVSIRAAATLFLIFCALAFLAATAWSWPSSNNPINYGILIAIFTSLASIIDTFRGNWASTESNAIVSSRKHFWLGVLMLYCGFGMIYLHASGKLYHDNNFDCATCWKNRVVGLFLNDLRDVLGAWAPHAIALFFECITVIIGIYLIKERLVDESKT